MEKGAKKREVRDEKQKDQKLEEQVLKSLEEAATPEAKLQLLLGKHVESERNNRRMRQELKVLEKQSEQIQRERENLQREYNKSVLIRDKMQEVCREQQKIIKSVKNESMLKIREEEERRTESQSKFQLALNEITISLTKNNEENLKLRDYNVEMTKKLKFLAEQYATREQQLEKMHEQVQLETQLHQAKLNKFQVESSMEKEILSKEKQIALEKLKHTQVLLKDLTDREVALKEQLNLYTAKYDDFQSSLQRSNEAFAVYKVDMEKLSKGNRKLEKECFDWRHKWEKSNATVIELATEKADRDEHAKRCSKKVEQLEKLLRVMQNERTHLYKVIKDNNIECPPAPELPPAPAPEPVVQSTFNTNTSERDKMDKMSRNCDELKQTLARLQDQMKNLNAKNLETETKPTQAQQQNGEAAKKRQKKKQKAKNKQASCNVGKESSPLSERSLSINENETKIEVKKEVTVDAVEETVKEPTEPKVTECVSAADQLNKSTEADKPIAKNVVEETKTPASVEMKEAAAEKLLDPVCTEKPLESVFNEKSLESATDEKSSEPAPAEQTLMPASAEKPPETASAEQLPVMETSVENVVVAQTPDATVCAVEEQIVAEPLPT